MNNKKMIVIVEATTVEFDRDEFMYSSTRSLNGTARIATLQDPYEEVEVTKEHIRGHVFENNRGERICLGLSNQVSKSLSFPFELIEQQQKEIIGLSHRATNLSQKLQTTRAELSRFYAMSLWDRFKFLFTGGTPCDQ